MYKTRTQKEKAMSAQITAITVGLVATVALLVTLYAA